MSLQEKLTNLRKEQKLSQLEVAEAISVSRQAVSKWEAGTTVPSTDNLKFLSDLYGVSVDYLLDDGVDTPAPPEEEAMEAQVQPALRKRFTLERKLIVALSWYRGPVIGRIGLFKDATGNGGSAGDTNRRIGGGGGR